MRTKTNTLEIKKRLVREGKSRIFNEWKSVAGITEEEFIAGLEWLEADPRDGSTGGFVGRMTRDLGCDPKRGLVKLVRCYSEDKHGVVIYEMEKKCLWSGTMRINMMDQI